eukprot:COSAG02_NODE_4384_length_5422_cov_23.616757_1_plen_78_part_00
MPCGGKDGDAAVFASVDCVAWDRYRQMPTPPIPPGRHGLHRVRNDKQTFHLAHLLMVDMVGCQTTRASYPIGKLSKC